LAFELTLPAFKGMLSLFGMLARAEWDSWGRPNGTAF